MLALATFASVRSANRAARVAERSLLAGLRPLLVPSRLDDPPQKVTFVDGLYLVAPGGAAVAEANDGAVLLAATLRNVGAGIAVLHGWHFYPELVTAPEHLRAGRVHALHARHLHRSGRGRLLAGDVPRAVGAAFARRAGGRGARVLDDRRALRRRRGRPAHDQPLRDAGARGRLARLGRPPLVRRPRRPALARLELSTVSTTSKFEPVTRPSVCSWSFDQPGLGAPLMYQFEPLSATQHPVALQRGQHDPRLAREAAGCRSSPSAARAGPSAAGSGRSASSRSGARGRRRRAACAGR